MIIAGLLLQDIG